MTMAVMGVIVLGGLLLVVIGILVGVRLGSRGDDVLGHVPTTDPATPDRAEPQITQDVLDALHEAAAGGDLTDEEIQRMLPGAKVVRHETTASSFQVQTPDGKTYDRVEDIPDPRLREQVRRILGQ